MLYIIGHKKPDLDAAASAVALEYVFNNADCFGHKKSRAVLADPANFETRSIFKKFNIDLPKVLAEDNIKSNDRFVLVDHNEAAQRLEGISDEQIIEIYDHHKINLNLATPIYINTKPWGSTATIIFWFMSIAGVKPTKNLAGLMISAILSDTQGFKSSTTCQKDKDTVKELNKIAKIDHIDKLIFEIFKYKSSLKGLSNKQILTKDYKIYDFSGKKVFINQIETVTGDDLIDKSGQLVKDLKEIKKEMSLDIGFCLITDILKVNSKVLASKKDLEILKTAFPNLKEIKNGVFDIGAIMSRKKEVAPAIERAIKNGK